MIEAVNTAMLELQSALTARSLYPVSHPKVRGSEQRAFELLGQVTAVRREVTLFTIGERVIYESETLPGSSRLSAALFRQLHESGVDRITFRDGLLEEELGQLLDTLTENVEARSVKPSTHVRLGFIQELGKTAPSTAAVPRTGQVPLPQQVSSVLGDVWSGVQQNRRVELDLLGDVVTTLSTMLTKSSSAMLPLASVKKYDEYTFVHTINVALLSTSLAEAVGLQDRMVHELNMAALLHDLGKQMIPKEILNKAGKFTDEEFDRVRRHPVDGARLLLATPGVPELAPIVAYEHHVRADGTGYPDVPRGWKLNLASRIVQVADVFDALRTNRPYRPALPLPKIVKLMQGDVGTMFDGDLLGVFFDKVVSRGIPEPAGTAG